MSMSILSNRKSLLYSSYHNSHVSYIIQNHNLSLTALTKTTSPQSAKPEQDLVNPTPRAPQVRLAGTNATKIRRILSLKAPELKGALMLLTRIDL